ncbi:tripartite tricarboxylate transporter substrate binding protein [Roseomonas nepalensis]|uniref:Tripartite tricarboxylate transporter substrate binding protein n=1 Tax=Muricoccus nepalensis TaxID=1854500 RepID=A0A502GE70_9PROT|nr:tripartite tricarboxylate transporter substrate binding protein [Roseomonas nepalensis]TPG59003.1 tripartite tricarboxylate transporter substrate binding protein [Roseomonas nepalensis]
MRLTRRRALGLGAALALPLPALAQRGFPDKAIRMLVPWAPGGTTDVQMRAVCEQAGRRLGQSVIVENKSGAGGILGAQALLNERPDGYTLSQMPISVFRVPFMSPRPPFDPLADFTYVSHLTGYLFGVVVRADAPWADFNAFLADAKANPGKFNYGTPGVGTSLHITMEQVATKRDLSWVHVPFRGVSENMQALLGGQIHATADSSGWGPLVEEGRLRLLVTWGPERAKRFPAVPTLKELGLDIVSTSPYGVAGPKGMDPAVVRVLDAAFRGAVADPAHMAVLDKFDMPPMPMGPEEYTAFVRRQVEEESAMIRRMGLRM